MNKVLAAALWGALLVALLLAWSPLYWPYTVALGGLAAVSVFWCFAGRGVILQPVLALPALIGIWGFAQLAAGHTSVPFLTLRASLTWAGCALAFLLGLNILRRTGARTLFLNLAMWSIAVLAIEALLQLYIAPERIFGLIDGVDSVTGTFIYRNQFAAVMELGGAIALWRMWNGKPVVGALCFAAMFGAAVATASRAGSVLMTAELIAFAAIAFATRGGTRARRVAGLMLVVFALIASAVAGTDALWERFQDKDMFAVRRELRNSTLKMIPAAPWFGTGMGTWREEYPKYATLDLALVANEAHNDWLQWTSDGGVFFGLLMLALAATVTAAARRNIWATGLTAVMLHCLVDYPMRSPSVELLWFTLAGAACTKRDVLDSETLGEGAPHAHGNDAGVVL